MVLYIKKKLLKFFAVGCRFKLDADMLATSFMPRLHMQVWLNRNQTACIKVFLCCQRQTESLLKIAGMRFDFLKLGNPFSQTSGFVPGCQNC